MNCLVDVNVSVPYFSVEGYGFNLCSDKTKTERLIFVAKHAALGIKSENWIPRYQIYMSTCRLLFL